MVIEAPKEISSSKNLFGIWITSNKYLKGAGQYTVDIDGIHERVVEAYISLNSKIKNNPLFYFLVYSHELQHACDNGPPHQN